MCKSCEAFNEHIRNGEAGKREAARQLFDEPVIQEQARYFFWKYQRYVSGDFPEWEDFYIEVVLRVFGEKEAGRGPRTNCEGYYYKLTRNICEEMVRYVNRSREVQVQLSRLDEITGDPRIIEKVKHYISQLDCKCSNLLYHYHIEETLIRDKKELVNVLLEKCGKSYTLGSIPVHLSGCLEKLTKLVQDDRDQLF